MRYILALVFATTVVAFANDVSAQKPLRGFFDEIERNRPRGRFLRKLFGEGEENQTRSQQTRAQQSSDAKNRQGQQPTPASNQNRGDARQPTTANPNDYPRPTNGTNFRANTQRKNAGKDRTSNSQGAPANGGKLEFGATVKPTANGTGMVISRVNPRGPAGEAGLKSGDVLNSIAGLEITNQEQLNDILEVLGKGDQIEVEYTRRGKSDKILVQFGEPDMDALSQQPTDRSNSRSTNNWNQSSGKPTTGNTTSGNAITGNATSRRSNQNGAYDPVQPPSNYARNGGGRQAGTARHDPVSVLSNLHDGSTPTRSPRRQFTNEQDLNRQVLELRKVIRQQEQVIEDMQKQLSNLRTPHTSNRYQPTLAPPNR